MNPDNEKISRREFLLTLAGGLGGVAATRLRKETPPVEVDIWEPMGLGFDPLNRYFLLMGDLHAGNSKNRVRQANTEVFATLRRVVANLKDLPFELFIQMGDMIQEAENEADNIANFEECLEILKPFPFPGLHLLGNHDLWGISKDKLDQIFRKFNLNPFHGVREYEDFQIIWLDLNDPPPGVHGALPEERIEWLRKTIHKDTPTFIFSHYGICPQKTKANYYFRGISWPTAYLNSGEIRRALKGLPVKAVINAHLHWGGHSWEDGIHQLTAPGFVENIASSDPNNCPGVYSILEITHPDRFTLQAYYGSNCFLSFQVGS